jgi:hypothetical protein
MQHAAWQAMPAKSTNLLNLCAAVAHVCLAGAVWVVGSSSVRTSSTLCLMDQQFQMGQGWIELKSITAAALPGNQRKPLRHVSSGPLSYTWFIYNALIRIEACTAGMTAGLARVGGGALAVCRMRRSWPSGYCGGGRVHAGLSRCSAGLLYYTPCCSCCCTCSRQYASLSIVLLCSTAVAVAGLFGD